MKLVHRVAATGGAGLLALALVACGDTSPEATTGETTVASPSETVTDGSTATQADEVHNDADTDFAQMMIVHHEGAIEMADLAVEKAASDDVRTLAEGISAAQDPEIEEMTSWLQAWGEEASPMGDMEGMDHGGMDMDGMDQEGAMAELQALSGQEFDRRFLELMIAHHEGAVDMAQTQLDNGDNPAALDLAQRIIDDQTTEIALMEQMLPDP